MRFIRGTLACLLAASLPAAALAGTVNWPQPGMNAAHTGFNAEETTLSPSTVGSLTRTWIAGAGGTVTGAPIEENGVIYALSNDGNLYAFKSRTGATLWTYPTGGNTNWGIASAGNIIYADCQIDQVSGGHQGVCALNAKTGALLWTWTVYYQGPGDQGSESQVLTVPVVANGLVFIDVAYYNDTNVFAALDATTGVQAWRMGSCGDTGDTGCNNIGAPPPAVANGALYTSNGLEDPPPNTNVALCKRAAASGAADWCFAALDSGQALAPTVSGNKVLFAASPGDGVTTNFYALDTATGGYAWHKTIVTPDAGNIHHAPAVANGVAYFSEEGNGSQSYYLYAFSLAKGTLLWSYTGGGSAGYLQSGVSVANGVVYASCENGQCAFDAATGAPLLTTDLQENSLTGTPLVANGTLVAVCATTGICLYTP